MRPPIVDEYRDLAIQKNQIDSKLKKLRPEIQRILDETGGFSNLYYQKKVITKWHEDVIYEWLLKEYPDVAGDISKITVNLDKLGEYAKLGIIDMSEMPLECMTDEVTYSIVTKEKKKETDESTESNVE